MDDTRASALEGIRATVTFPTPSNCPIAAVAADASTSIDQVARSVPSDGAAPVTEFQVDADAVPAALEFEPIFSYGRTHLFRRVHDGDGDPCPCERLGAFGCPVERYAAREGTLTLAFHAADFTELQTVVADLRERFPDVDIRRLVRSPTSGHPEDTVFVDRGRLTERQLEVLTTAYERGYFDRPRGANATELADALGIDPSTFSEHLRAAQSKLVGEVLEER
jgi:DNA-binding transcriptional ArsR family regulator